MPPNTSSSNMRTLAKPSDSPRCENSAARPMPAARPASGPSQRDAPAAAGVGVGAAFGDAACAGAAGVAGEAALGVLGGRCRLALRAQAAAPAQALGLGRIRANHGECGDGRERENQESFHGNLRDAH